MPKVLRSGLLLAVLVYVVLRGLILYSAFDSTAMTMFELYPMGTLPKVLLEGAELPLSIYYDNAAGQLVTGYATLPFYLAFGETYLALKLVPATFGLGALLCSWYFLDLAFGRRAAFVGTLLFALGPVETLTKYSLMASGNHFEHLFFNALALLCFYRLHLGGGRRNAHLFLSGLTMGLALFVFLGAIIPVGMMALVHLGARGWRGTLKDLGLGGGGLLLGILPLVLINLSTDGRGADFLGAKFLGEGRHELGRLAARAWQFLVHDLPAAGFFGQVGPLSASLLNGLFLACFLIAWLVAAPLALRALSTLVRGLSRAELSGAESRTAFSSMKLLPLVSLLPLTTVAFALSDLRIGGHQPPIECAGYRYFLPHFQFAIFLIAALAAHPAGFLRILGTTVAGVACSTGLWNLGAVDFSFSNPNLGAHYRGYNFMQTARGLVSPKADLSAAEMVSIADDLQPVLRHRLYLGIGFNRAGLQWPARRRNGREKGDFLNVEQLLAELPGSSHIDLARGAGRYIRFQALMDGDDALLIANLTALTKAGAPYARTIVEGAAGAKDYPLVSLRVGPRLNDSRRLLSLLPPDLQPAFALGIGLECGRLVRRGIPSELDKVEALLRAMPATLIESTLEGIGWGLADGGAEPALPMEALPFIPPPHHAPLKHGYAAGLRHLFGPAQALEHLDRVPADWREALESLILDG